MVSDNGSGVRLEAAAVGFPTALATAVGLIIAGSVLLTAQTGFGAGGGVFAWAILIAWRRHQFHECDPLSRFHQIRPGARRRPLCGVR